MSDGPSPAVKVAAPDRGSPDVAAPRFQEGEPTSARKFNKMSVAIDRLSPGITPPYALPPKSAAAQGKIQQMRVAEVRGDFLLCWAADGGTTTIPVHTDQPLVRVAKPWLLRRSPFDTLTRAGITYTYSSDTERVAADEDEHEEDQVVVPSYEEGDVIYATASVAGGVIVRAVGTDTGSDEAVEWLDLNVDGRAWGSA